MRDRIHGEDQRKVPRYPQLDAPPSCAHVQEEEELKENRVELNITASCSHAVATAGVKAVAGWTPRLAHVAEASTVKHARNTARMCACVRVCVCVCVCVCARARERDISIEVDER